MREFPEVCVVAGVSWGLGVLSSAALNRLILYQPLGPDFLVVAGWSGAMFFASVICVYLPILYPLSGLFDRFPRWLAALIGAALSTIPLGMLHYLWEGQFRVVLGDTTARLFMPIFMVAGGIFAYGSIAQSSKLKAES